MSATTSAAAAPRANTSDVLVVFDYDWSLVNENSDTFIFRELHAPLLDAIERERAQWTAESSWTALMDKLLGELVAQQPHVTPALIRETLARIPVLDRMLDAVRLAVDTHGADVKIVSDANTVYIESMLAHHGLSAHVSEIFTNRGFFELNNGAASESNRLRVEPYHARDIEPHGCRDCPANMCKGAILDAIRSARPYTHVLYVGDGQGDFCPATRLTASDVVFARADDSASGKAYGLLKRLQRHSERVTARVEPWSSGDDIYRHFAAFFAGLDRST